jgi:hypothetical protein
MKFVLPPPEKRIYALQALKTVAMASGEIHDNQRKMLQIALDVMKAPTTIDALEPIDAETLAANIEDDELRLALIQRLIIMTILDGEVVSAEIDAVETFAAALGVEDKLVRNMRQLVDGHYKRMAFDIARRSFAPKQMRHVWSEEGLKGILKIAKSGMGITDAKQTERFKALGHLGENTLGYHLYQEFEKNGFPFPGEKGGLPENMLFHDVSHIISGYGNDPKGEMLVAGFQAGYLGEDGMIMVMMISFLFQLGIDPIAKARGVDPTKNMLEFDSFRKAFLRGKSLNTNLMNWDPWPHMERSVEELRAELGLVEDPV